MTYVALLRGINVGGNRKIAHAVRKLAELMAEARRRIGRKPPRSRYPAFGGIDAKRTRDRGGDRQGDGP